MPIDAGAVISVLGAATSVGAAIWIHARQLRLALFDRRVAIYDATCGFLSHVSSSGEPHDMEQLVMFLRDTRNAGFLFNSEVPSLLNDIYKKAVAYRSKHAVWLAGRHGPDRTRLYDEQAEQQRSFHEMWVPVKSEFRKYIDLGRIGPEFEGL